MKYDEFMCLPKPKRDENEWDLGIRRRNCPNTGEIISVHRQSYSMVQENNAEKNEGIEKGTKMRGLDPGLLHSTDDH